MRLWLLTLLILLIISPAAKAQLPPDKVIHKTLGDINGDGQPEAAIETTSYGASSYHTQVKIMEGEKVVLVLPWFSGDTSDGYKVVDRQIVAWQGDWHTGNKWSAHYYDFTWYRWSPRSKNFEIAREGFTTKAYSYKQAKKQMPLLVAKPGRKVILSRYPTFIQEAQILAGRKYPQIKLIQFGEFTGITSQRNESWPANVARAFWGVDAEPIENVKVEIKFLRDGTVKIEKYLIDWD